MFPCRRPATKTQSSGVGHWYLKPSIHYLLPLWDSLLLVHPGVFNVLSAESTSSMDAQHSGWTLTLDEPTSDMAVHLCSVRPLPLLIMLLVALLPVLNSVLITDEEAALLAETRKDILCFSRTFMDLTCFWDESARVDRAYRFFYTYKGDSSRECTLTSLKHSDGDWRHICIFPTGHLGIRLFIDLYVEVLDTINNHTMRSQHLSVEAVGLIAPPMNITAEWPRVARQLRVTWIPPPINYKDFLVYEVAYGVEGSSQPSSRAEAKNRHTYHLMDLLPGQQYHIQVRTKPDGISFDGLWGPWSPAVSAETPHLPGEIDLQCFTPDLHQLHCQWNWEPTEPGHTYSLLYWAEDNSISTRTQAWHKCEEKEERTKSHYQPHFHVCTFQPSNTTYISVLVVVTQGQSQHEVNYFKEPFELHHVVRTAPPRILQANVDRGMLKLEWVPPLEELTAHMMYHIRYAAQNSQNWKDLQVQYSNNSEIHLATGGHYCLQLRTQPDGERFRGDWSAWSESECIEVPPGAGSTILTVAVALLLCGVLVLGLGCTFFSMHSMKQKLWPPIPDLHHVLDGFLEDNSKQQQQQVSAFFCNKTLEDASLTCLLEVLPETPSYGPLPNTMPDEQAEWDSQPSSHQHYMVLSPNNPQGNHPENEYFDGKDDSPQTGSEPKVQLCSFASFSTPLSASETKEEAGWEASEEQSISPTHISNQSYLLMG